MLVQYALPGVDPYQKSRFDGSRLRNAVEIDPMIILKSRLPGWFGADAITLAPFILVDPASAQDTALIAHEEVHAREQLRCLVLPWWFAYLLSKKFRQAAEVRAYLVQIRMGGIRTTSAARYLATLYRLGISETQALAVLQEADSPASNRNIDDPRSPPSA